MKIPHDWQIATLGGLGDWKGGGTPSKSRKEYWDGNIPWASPKDFKGGVLSETEDSITPMAVQRSSTALIGQGSIIFVTRSGILRHKVPVAVNTVSVAINQDLKALNTYTEYCALFVFYTVQAFNDAIRKQTVKTGTTVESIDFQSLKNFQIPLPPTLTEQRAIATALSDVDRLLSACDQLIAKKKAIKQGAMQELLTGRRRLEGFEGEWRDWKVGAIGYTYSGLTGKTKEDFDRGDGRYITFLNVMNNVRIDINILESVNVNVGEHQNTAQVGDLFFNTSSETPGEVGMCAVLLEDVSQVYLNSFCFGFRLHEGIEIEPIYLAYYFRSSVGRNAFFSLAQGATRYNLSKSNFNNITLNLPQLDEQHAIAQILTDMDAEIAALEQQRDKYKAVKAGMMQELLTGKTRLI